MWSTAKFPRERVWRVGRRRSEVVPRTRRNGIKVSVGVGCGAFSRHELRRPRGDKQKAPEAWLTTGARYLSVRRRPGYSSSGCTPAEPDSASPGKTSLPRECRASKEIKRIRVERRFRRVEDWSGRPDAFPGGRKGHRRREGSSRYQASTDRQWAKTESGASTRRRSDTDRR